MRIHSPAALLALTLATGCIFSSSESSSPAPPQARLGCNAPVDDTVAFLSHLGCIQDWQVLEGRPDNASHGVGTAVKFAYSLDSQRLWFVNTRRFSLHWDFMEQVVGIPQELEAFPLLQYFENPDRHYVLGTVVRYPESGHWTMQLYTGDNLSASRLGRVYQALVDSLWIGDDLKFLAGNDSSAARALAGDVPVLDPSAVYRGQNYQCMNAGEAFGILTFASKDTVSQGRFTPRSIVVTDGLPDDLPVVAGVVTADFQTPLSHINVLSINRKTPNMALRRAWTDASLRALEGRLVHLQVGLDGFSVAATTIADATTFWEAHGPGKPPSLQIDTTAGLVPVEDLGYSTRSRVGAKAANFGELAKLAAKSVLGWKVPEGGFAIPFHAYLSHLRRNAIDADVERLLSDSRILQDDASRLAALAALRQRIRTAPVDPVLLYEVAAAIRRNGKFTRMRFRSSTNAEDLAEFNGAGLYESFTGDLADAKKPVADAIRNVWASLWNDRAFAERQYFGIDQKQVAMGILVHRGFPDEGANGVAITRNIYRPQWIGYVINAQVGESPVVAPPAGVTTEQLVYYPVESTYSPDPSVETISTSSLTGGRPVLGLAEIRRLGTVLGEIQRRFAALFDPSLEQPLWFGLDAEFKFEGVDRTLYLKQARPLP